MASLLGTSFGSTGTLGTTGVSALVKSAQTLANEVNTFNDTTQSIAYQNSAKTDDDFHAYEAYLTSRVSNLESTGSITDLTKAANLRQTITSAFHSNASSNIQRENIQIMAGNGSLTDKYNIITSEYAKAVSIGDDSLAQTLESQAYSVNQSIQYQAQQASSAAATLRSAAVSYQGEVVTSLDNGLKELNSASKSMSEVDFNKYSKAYVQSNAENMAKLGVVLPKGAQPNYFDIVQGITAAKYNALVMKAQAEAPINPTTAGNYAQDATFLNNGTTKIQTLGGSLTIQELQQAASDPSMFAYNNATGQYQRTTQTGYQYINGQVAPTYSGTVSAKAANQFYFLTPQETTNMTKLGLNVTASINKNGTVGTGITVQATQTTPDWLKSVLGANGEAQMFNQNGDMTFKSGDAFYSVIQDGKGLSGLYQHSPDGTLQALGGDYGFNGAGVQLLINNAQSMIQQSITEAKTAYAQTLKLAKPLTLPKLSVAPPTPAPTLKAAPQLNSAVDPQTVNPQKTASPQPAASGLSVQGSNVALQGGVNGFNLNQSGGGGIRLK